MEQAEDNRVKVTPAQIEEPWIRAEFPRGCKEVFIKNGKDIKGHLDEYKARMQNRTFIMSSCDLYRIFSYRNDDTKRPVKFFHCDHQGCHKILRKWHDLQNHLRSHTKEKPF